jgi:predicted DNA binding protein
MSTVMAFTSPVESFPLGSVFESLPGVTVELERLVPDDRLLIPYFWVRDCDPTNVEAAFADHAGLHGVTLVDSVAGECLMRAQWDQSHEGVLDAIHRNDLVLLSGVGTRDGWTFRVRGESREVVGAFRSHCIENGIPLDITAVHALLPVQDESYNLTEPQREALVLAHEQGYFDSPPEATLAEVASVLDITQQSLSSRLRRGQRRLLGATLVRD